MGAVHHHHHLHLVGDLGIGVLEHQILLSQLAQAPKEFKVN
jgi:hypothetical protein